MTLGGNFRRAKRQSGEFDLGSKRWSRTLPRITVLGDQTGTERVRVAETADGLLGYHPVVTNGLVAVGDPNHIRVFRLEDGKAAWPTGAKESDPDYASVYRFERADYSFHLDDRPQVGVGRFTSTVAGR